MSIIRCDVFSRKHVEGVSQFRVTTKMKNFRLIAPLLELIACLMFCRSQPILFAASHEATTAASPLQVAAGAGAVSDGDSDGLKAYQSHCAMCHGDHRAGNLPGVPSLLGIGRRMTDEQITDMVHKGKGRMPPFPTLEGKELASLLHYLGTVEPGSAPPASTGQTAVAPVNAAAPLSPEAQAGATIFLQNCAFCHGRDTMGGESGPDLTRSRLVRTDKKGDKISEVVLNGRPEKKMPAFNFNGPELQNLAAFIHAEAALAPSAKGGRRGVDVSDLQTGNVASGKQYFESECARCHSPSGDLAGVANRYEGLELEERMLYPREVKSRITVTLPSGQTIAGALEYQDEFTVALRDEHGEYHSWQTDRVRYKVDSPVEAHVDLFSKYTDADIHNLMAYLQTMK